MGRTRRATRLRAPAGADVRLPLRNRIVETRMMDPKALTANPRNVRIHGPEQVAVMRAMLQRVGFVAPVMMNQRSELLVDGHLRVQIAAEDGEKEIPVSIVDLDPDEEAVVLAAYDPLSALAAVDAAAQVELVMSIEAENDALGQLLSGMMAEAMPVAAAQAMLDGSLAEGGDDVRGWGIGQRADLVKVVVKADQLPIIELALQQAGTMNRGDALAGICMAYLATLGIAPPLTQQ